MILPRNPFPNSTRLSLDTQVDEDTGCWNWLKCKDGFGYGMIKVGTRALRVHRVSAVIHMGMDISDPRIVRHKCDNPGCWNPEHLEFGTRADNSKDRDERGRHWSHRGSKHHAAKLTEEGVLSLRCRVEKGETIREVADAFGISYHSAWGIVRRKSWKWL